MISCCCWRVSSGRRPPTRPASRASFRRSCTRCRCVAVIANGELDDPDKAEAQLASGGASLAAVARGALPNANRRQRVAEDTAQKAFDTDMIQPLATLDNQADWETNQANIFEPLHKSL